MITLLVIISVELFLIGLMLLLAVYQPFLVKNRYNVFEEIKRQKEFEKIVLQDNITKGGA